MVAATNRWADRVGPDLVAMLDGWASAGHGSLSRRLAHGLRLLVDSGVLPGGWRLPPERVLAGQLAVGRTTVTQALDELRGEGLLTSRQGSGTYVVGPAAPLPVGTRVAEHLSSGPGIDLAKGDAPDLSHLPPVSIEMWQLNATCGGAAVNAAGLPAMRQAIAELYTRGGTTGRPRTTEPDQIHVTAGSHQGSFLLVSALAAPGKKVAVAELSYPGRASGIALLGGVRRGIEARSAAFATASSHIEYRSSVIAYLPVGAAAGTDLAWRSGVHRRMARNDV